MANTNKSLNVDILYYFYKLKWYTYFNVFKIYVNSNFNGSVQFEDVYSHLW